LKEVIVNWKDWKRFKSTLEFFIADNEIFYKEYDGIEKDNIKKREKPYFMFEDAVSNEKINKEGLAEYIKQLQHITIIDTFRNHIHDQILIL
jgi:hypothetical protein